MVLESSKEQVVPVKVMHMLGKPLMRAPSVVISGKDTKRKALLVVSSP